LLVYYLCARSYNHNGATSYFLLFKIHAVLEACFSNFLNLEQRYWLVLLFATLTMKNNMFIIFYYISYLKVLFFHFLWKRQIMLMSSTTCILNFLNLLCSPFVLPLYSFVCFLFFN
jgi:hypothetical protein